MTDARTRRRRGNQLLTSMALLAFFVILAAWKIAAIREAPLEPVGALVLGVILGAITAMIVVVRHRWRRYLTSRL